MTAFSYASFTYNEKTWRSLLGHIIFLNCALIMQYDKRKAKVKSSTFSLEFLALKATLEAIQFLQFKLRSFSAPMMNEEADYIYCDNQ